MDARKQILLGILVVSIFIFLVSVLVFAYVLYSKGEQIPDFLMPFIEYHIHFMVLMGLFGVSSGIIVYKILNETIEKQNKVVKTNSEIIMKFLSSEDREVLRLLQEHGGMTTQSEIARLPGMSRLKAHRIVKKLSSRGIIYIEKYGKINMIRVVDELRDLQ